MRITVGSRQSRLAVRQVQIVMEELEKYHPEAEVSLVTMKTTGDRILHKTLDQIGGKAFLSRSWIWLCRRGGSIWLSTV